MKTLAPVLAVLVIAAAPLAAQPPRTPVVQSLKVLESVLPVYPHQLLQMGRREGEVRVAFSVDPTGKVDDFLAVAYTHPDFAESTITALKRWRFEPARYNGEPIAAATELSVRFEVEGTVVVSLTAGEALNARMALLTDDHEGYRPRTLRELDRIPTPMSAPSPAFPARLATPGARAQVTVSFYIDEQGKVRMPSVEQDADPELAAIAIAALRNWKFEPPMCKGRPVLVRASQQFNFRSPDVKASTASNG